MLKKDLHPPHSGLAADPVLYGIAAGLAQLFPLVEAPGLSVGEHESAYEGRDDHGEGEGE